MSWLERLLRLLLPSLFAPAAPAKVLLFYFPEMLPVVKLQASLAKSADPLVTAATVFVSLDGAAPTANDVTAGPVEIDASDAQTLSVFGTYTNKYGKPSPQSPPQTMKVGDLIPAPSAPSGVALQFVDDVPDAPATTDHTAATGTTAG